MNRSRQVWKYELPYQRDVVIKMPKGAEILHVGFQQEEEKVFLWALVNPEAIPEERCFTVVGTGEDIKWDQYAEKDPKADHLATIPYKAMVYHVFEGAY